MEQPENNNPADTENVTLQIDATQPNQPPNQTPNQPPNQTPNNINIGMNESANGENESLNDDTDQSTLVTEEIDWFNQTEYVVFSNELKSMQRNNVIILKECKDNKRLLDLKYDDLNNLVNNIQTSVIFFSAMSGFIQATRIQFAISDAVTSIFSITISTYITLLLSISKYYKLDEIKEKIQNIREKYSVLDNKLDHRMDELGPWSSKNLWIHQDPIAKYKEWSVLSKKLDDDYDDIILTKQALVTEFEIIMDTKSRNQYYIKNRELNYKNRELLYNWDKKESELETRINKNKVHRRPSSIKLQHEELDNWADEV
jgi:hypothetical protein